MRITLAIENGTIREAVYKTYQWPGCVACGKAICELVTGKSLEDSKTITHPVLVERVGPLAPHRHCELSIVAGALL